MKNTAFSVLLGLSLTLGSAVVSKAEDQNIVRIPQGRGQYIEIHEAKPATVALFAPKERHDSKAQITAEAPSKFRPVTITNSHGSSTTLFERVK